MVMRVLPFTPALATYDCWLTGMSVIFLQHVMHQRGVHPPAGVADLEGLPGMDPQLLKMGHHGVLVLARGILGMTRMHPRGGMVLLPLDEMPLLQLGVVLDGRQMRHS